MNSMFYYEMSYEILTKTPLRSILHLHLAKLLMREIQDKRTRSRFVLEGYVLPADCYSSVGV